MHSDWVQPVFRRKWPFASLKGTKSTPLAVSTIQISEGASAEIFLLLFMRGRSQAYESKGWGRAYRQRTSLQSPLAMNSLSAKSSSSTRALLLSTVFSLPGLLSFPSLSLCNRYYLVYVVSYLVLSILTCLSGILRDS